MLGVQGAALVATLAGSLGVLVAAVLRTGDTGALLAPGLDRLGDPAESLPAQWNPILWVMVVGIPLAYFVYPVGVIAVLAGVALLIYAGQDRDWRTVAWTAVVTVSWLVVTVVAATPYGRELHRWILD